MSIDFICLILSAFAILFSIIFVSILGNRSLCKQKNKRTSKVLKVLPFIISCNHSDKLSDVLMQLDYDLKANNMTINETFGDNLK